MALTTCNECGKDLSDTAKACPHCGAKVPRPSIWPWVLGVPFALFVAFLMFGAAVGSSPEAKEKAHARDAIQYCWSRQETKSFDPSTQRFVAATCELMEKNFRDKYGAAP